MEQDYHILSIETFSNTEYGKMIRIVACPYEDTPLGYCYILNKQKKFNYPYSTDIFYRLSKLQESDSFSVNVENFVYNVEYGYIHKSCTESKKEVSDYTPIDLGLSVIWADRNLGANSPEDYGVMKSYNELMNEGLIPKGWRLPTSDEFKELELLSMKISNRKNDCYFLNGEKQIVLPPAGCAIELNIYRQGQWGQYLGVYPNKKDVQCHFTVATVGQPFIGATFDPNQLYSIRFVKDK